MKRFLVRVGMYLAFCWGVLALTALSASRWAFVAVVGLAMLTTVPLAIVARHRGWPRYPGAAVRLFVVRPFWYVQLLLPLVTIGALAGGIIGALTGAIGDGARMGASVVLVAMGLLLGAGYIGSRRLRTRRLDLEIPGLPADLDGLVIAQLTDLHVGPHLSARFLDRAARSVRESGADIIAVTGDLLDDRAEDVTIYARHFGALRAPLGVYVVPGNHDVYSGWAEVRARLERAGCGTVLVNEHRLLRRGATSFAIVGTGDPAGRAWRGDGGAAAPDIPRALAGIPGGTPIIALAHNPALWPALASAGVEVTLSGHTHWGQFSIPSLRWSLASPFLTHAMDLHREGRSLLYISPGTNYWGLPFRLGAPAEVTVHTLRRAA